MRAATWWPRRTSSRRRRRRARPPTRSPSATPRRSASAGSPHRDEGARAAAGEAAFCTRAARRAAGIRTDHARGAWIMVMRRRRPVMRAAMMGGAGYYAGKKMQEGRQQDAYRDARLDEVESQQAAAAPAAAAPAGAVPDSTIETLKQLAQLHDQGVLTDDEFAAQKRKLLGG